MFGSSRMKSVHFNSALGNTAGFDIPRLPADMMFGRSFIRTIRDVVNDWSAAMDHVNMAVREGKALDQLEQQLSRISDFEGMIVDEMPIANQGERECYVTIVMAKPPLREIQSTIAHTVAYVNMMNGTGIRVRIMA